MKVGGEEVRIEEGFYNTNECVRRQGACFPRESLIF